MDCFQSLDPSLLDLVERAINISKSDRPSMETILNLPYFWTDKKSLDYFVTIFNDQLNVKNSIHRTGLFFIFIYANFFKCISSIFIEFCKYKSQWFPSLWSVCHKWMWQ